mgnify:CR=1 FL=1
MTLRRLADGYIQGMKTRIMKEKEVARIAELHIKLKAAFEAGDKDYLRSTGAEFAALKTKTVDELDVMNASVVYLEVLGNPENKRHKATDSVLHERVGRVPPSISGWIRRDPELYMGPLVKALMAGIYDPFERVKVIHDWIADNIRYNFEGYKTGNVGDNSWVGVLKSGVSVCAGYANLFDHMSNLAGIESKVISGYSKGYSYDPYEIPEHESNHAWNAVRILGRWYLLDVTWDSGYINYFGQSVKAYSSKYLFTDPLAFLYSHFPESSSDQLLPSPISWDAFLNLPNLMRPYFDLGLSFEKELPVSVVRISEHYELKLSLPPGILLSASVFEGKGKAIEQSTLVQPTADKVTMLARFPEPGKYKIVLFGKKPESKPDRYEALVSIPIEFSGNGSVMPAFPLLYRSFYDPGCRLDSPLSRIQ